MSRPEFFKELVDSLYDAVYCVDTDRKITYWNRAAQALTGYSAEEVVGRSCSAGILGHVDEDGEPLCGTATCPAAQVMRNGLPREESLFLKHKAGHRLPIITRITPMRDTHGQVVGATEIFQDASSNRLVEQRLEDLERLAGTDDLTGLANRRITEELLGQKLSSLRRYGHRFGLLFFDVDGFKNFNDQYGHARGDRILKVVARTLKANIRGDDVVCRWGGDEFLLVVNGGTLNGLRGAADKLRNMISRSSLHTDTGIVSLTVSIGATPADPSDTVPGMISRADALMYQAKSVGGNRVFCAERQALEPETQQELQPEAMRRNPRVRD